MKTLPDLVKCRFAGYPSRRRARRIDCMAARVIDNVVSWLNEGYPHGIPQQDYFPLLALLARSLSDDDVVTVAQAVMRGADSDSVSPHEVRAALHVVTDWDPDTEEFERVASRLASVGWSLTASAR